MTAAAAAKEQKEAKEVEVVVRVPSLNKAGYVTRHLDVHLPAEAAQNLRSVFNGLHARHAQLKSGKHVESTRDALIYLLENMKEEKKSEK